MTKFDKIVFVGSFIWFLHWGSCITFKFLDMVIGSTSVRVLPIGL